ncbi:MAG TPA: hypothetical protein VN794_18770 [Methylomirabilota bacterium]|nr:hypothetical protein [Methylomirabilota bacterium]
MNSAGKVYLKPVCRGSYALGSACGRCERCEDARAERAADITRRANEANEALVAALVGKLNNEASAVADLKDTPPEVHGERMTQAHERRKDWIENPPGEELTPVDLDHWEFHCVDGIFIKQMHLKNAGTYVPQHEHKYAHNSMLAAGSVRVWREKQWHGDFKAPTAILIEAGVKHTFLSLEPDTIVYCIHNTSRSNGQVEITAENSLEGLKGS